MILINTVRYNIFGVDYAALIPKHKSDVEAARKAASVGYPTIEPILGELLIWMKDMNWPVASEIELVLRDVGVPLSQHVLAVLQGGDDVWKYWVLQRIALNFDEEARKWILDECVRIVNSPTKGEIAEEVHLVAHDIIILDSFDSAESMLSEQGVPPKSDRAGG